MAGFFGRLRRTSSESEVEAVNRLRVQFAALSEDKLRDAARHSNALVDVTAIAAAVATRVLGLEMFDVQLRGALALARGRIAEMQTGEGKTLAAVPAVVFYAKAGRGVHVMTVNDYLARRDAAWMGDIYRFFGLSVGCIQQGMAAEERQRAYACDVTYATANEIGFDYLRDQLALYPREQVHRPFEAALIDEADSILIDEARIPLVIAGGEPEAEPLARRVDRVVRHFTRNLDYTIDEYSRNVALTNTGINAIEASFACGNLFDPENLGLFTAVQDALHAHALLRRDVDYVVKDGVIGSVDEFKGRIVPDRRWPAGLHAAVEAKEGIAPNLQGRVLASITLQNLIAQYPTVCGMTGTAATEAAQFRKIYGLHVEVIPTNRPVVREDHPDVIFPARHEKEAAVVAEVVREHARGRPVLIGTASVEESERLSAALQGIPHNILNARNEEREAAIIARAGERGAVTVSTNMAGRGTDIRLGEGVAELGGLYVIGTNRHESRRIDNQLRGRAGRQGDPGSSRFFISLEDDLLVKYGINDPKLSYSPDGVQRVIEGQNLEIRQFLNKYEGVIEGQRQAVQRRRQAILTGETACASELERLVTLAAIDDLWSDYLAAVADLRAGITWVSLGGKDPFHHYLTRVHALFEQFQASVEEEAQKTGAAPTQRGATWTYLTTDQPFGNMTERFIRGLVRKALGGGVG